MFNWLFDLFRKQNHMRIARESLQTAQIELLQAQHCREHYQHTEDMLHERIGRLKNYIDSDPRKETSNVRAIER